MGPKRRSAVGRQDPCVATPKPKEFRYAIDLRDELRTEDGTPLHADDAWSPEHLLLAALVRCSLKSLEHHAASGGIHVEHAEGSARALIQRRESDGRFAVTETDVGLHVRFTQQPGEDELATLFAKAERDCFIGASLAVKPSYSWSAL
jgi:organic hydroperoxide reductase OsmC/OhrA